MSEQASEPGTTTNVEVQGDAVVNQAPDGGGVDNNAEGSGSQSGDSKADGGDAE